MSAYHAQDGWYFRRHPDGSVTIERDGATVLAMSPEGWSSAVASVSAGGEESGRYYVARAFHMGTEVGCACPIDTLHRLDCVLGINPPPVKP